MTTEKNNTLAVIDGETLMDMRLPLLVYHLRKQGDSDPLNKLSGTTGIIGAVDAVFVLDQSKRNATGATLICTGRNIAYRELALNFSKENYVWERISDSLDDPALTLPRELVLLVEFMKQERTFSGSNTTKAVFGEKTSVHP